MSNSKLLFSALLLWGILLLPQPSLAQKEREFEKELKEANLNVYQDAEKAVQLSTAIYKNAKQADTKIAALITLVNGYNALNQNGKALKYATKTLELAEKSKNEQHQVWALGLLGEQYQQSHLNGISREYLDRAETLLQKADLSTEAIAVSRGNIFAIKGNGYKDEIDCGYAIKNYDLAIDSYKTIPEDSAARNNLALVFLEKGTCLLELGNLNLAEKNFHLALDIAQTNKLEEYIQKANLGLAKIDAAQCEYQVSNATALKLLDRIDGALSPKLKNDLYSLLSTNYLYLGNLEEFVHYNNKFKTSSQHIHELEKNQFQQVLQFVESQPGKSQKQNIPLSILFYCLLAFTIFLMISEIYLLIKAQKKAISV